jgi:galactonate dehydratase
MRESKLKRRELLAAAGAGAGLPLLAAVGKPPQLKVTALEVVVVKVNQRGDWIFVRLKTDKGVTGLGEASHGGGFTQASRDRNAAMQKALAEFFELVRGQSPFEIERYRERGRAKARAGGRLTATAFSALEQAMWDVAGRALGAPVHSLLGGKLREDLDIYANINRATNVDRSPEAFAANAAKAVGEGFRAIKAAVFDDFPRLNSPAAELAKFKELGIARVEAIRKAIGPDVKLLIDVHSHFDVPLSVEVARRLEPVNLFFYEEPVPPQRLAETAQIRSAIKQTMAGGEVLFGVESFVPLCRNRALHVVMPDVKHCGGIIEARKIAVVAEVDDVQVSPHNPSGPVATAASVQLCAGIPNFLILEHAWGEAPWRPELIQPPEQFVKGRLRVPEGPGFGIELNDKVVKAHA